MKIVMKKHYLLLFAAISCASTIYSETFVFIKNNIKKTLVVNLDGVDTFKVTPGNQCVHNCNN